MKILALDAAIGPFSVALDIDGRMTRERSDRNDALEAGLGRIAGLLDAAGQRLGGLDRIAVGLGPGSFTGIRIALSFAKALAYGSGVPLVGISSYDALTPAGVSEPALTVVSGRAGIVCARLLASGSVSVACGPTPSVIERLLGTGLARGTLTVVAATEDVFPNIGEGTLRVIRMLSPAAHNPAAAIAILARTRDPALSPHGLTPDYGEIPAVTMPKAGVGRAP